MCSFPGCSNPLPEEPSRPGFPRRLCDVHTRAGPNREHKARHLARGSRAEELEDLRRRSAKAQEPLKLAAGLRVATDPELAAAMFGIRARGTRLAKLAVEARARFPGVVEGGLSELGAYAEAATLVLLAELVERRHEMPARDVANALRATLQIAAEAAPEGGAPKYATINLTVIPPPENLTPEQAEELRRRARGEL